MPKDVEFEALLDLAPNAFELKTGEELDHLSPKRFERFSNTAGWEKTAKTRPGKATDRFCNWGAVSRLCSAYLDQG